MSTAPTESWDCTRCTFPVDVTAEHVTVTRQVEHRTAASEDADTITLISELVAMFHPGCAPAADEVIPS